MSKRPEINEATEDETRMEGEGQANLYSWKQKEATDVMNKVHGSGYSKGEKEQILNAPAGLGLQEALHFQKQTRTKISMRKSNVSKFLIWAASQTLARKFPRHTFLLNQNCQTLRNTKKINQLMNQESLAIKAFMNTCTEIYL
jgi:hypothetical protein